MPTTEHIQVLRELGERVKAHLRPRAERVMNVQIGYAYLSKANRTVDGILMLFEAELKEEAQALVRMLFEACIQFDWYKRLCTRDARDATLRFLDAILIEKHKQYKASGLSGSQVIDGIEVMAGIEEDFKKSEARYNADELRLIRKHGFSQRSTEALARETGHDSIYQILYRNFSRNVHARDHTETLLKEALVADAESDLYRDYLSQRDAVTVGHTFGMYADLLRSIIVGLDLPFLEDWEAIRLARESEDERKEHRG